MVKPRGQGAPDDAPNIDVLSLLKHISDEGKMFVPTPATVAQRNRSKRLIEVLRYFSSLNGHPPLIEASLSEDNGEPVVIVKGSFHYRSEKKISLLQLFYRDDLPDPQHITDIYLRGLERARRKAEKLPLEEARHQFLPLIFVAESFRLMREADKDVALTALTNGDFAPLQAFTQRYPTAFFPPEASAQVFDKTIQGDEQAKAIQQELSRKVSGRRTSPVETKQALNRERQQKFHRKVQKEQEAIARAIATAIAKLPRKVQKDKTLFAKMYRDIVQGVLDRFLSSADAAKREAGKIEKLQWERKLRQAFD